MQRLDCDQLDAWALDGWLVIRGALSTDELSTVIAGVDELAEWAVTGGPGLHHFEATEAGPTLARSERFAEAHESLGRFVSGGIVVDHVAAVLGEPAVLFKEKVNYKQPGGGGFAPHQDATAYRFVDHHVSVMVPLDPATVASGCLSFATGHRDGQMATDHRGRIEASVAERLDWRPVEVEPGDLVLFDSYAPHQSGTNTTDRARRALYLTYNARRHGDQRLRYYVDKQAEFERLGPTFDGDRVRISITDDFLGRPVPAPGTGVGE